MAKRKKWNFGAIVVGVFLDKEHTIWSRNTKVYSSVKEYINDVGTDNAYYERLCTILGKKPEEMNEYLEKHDGKQEMRILVMVLLSVHTNIAIKGFRNTHDANCFLSLLEQINYESFPTVKIEDYETDMPKQWFEEKTNLRHRSLL